MFSYSEIVMQLFVDKSTLDCSDGERVNCESEIRTIISADVIDKFGIRVIQLVGKV